ncbi:unnamed protein product [Amoebophrya sp. A25]|nr:unnamed protein product [Amoebophrya sp. A25]|eukprot:GSA25T00013049001.1
MNFEQLQLWLIDSVHCDAKKVKLALPGLFLRATRNNNMLPQQEDGRLSCSQFSLCIGRCFVVATQNGFVCAESEDVAPKIGEDRQKRRVQANDVFELISDTTDHATEERGSSSITHLRANAKRVSNGDRVAEGWITLQTQVVNDGNCTTLVESFDPLFKIAEATVLTDAVSITDSNKKMMRRMRVGERALAIDAPQLDESSGMLRLQVVVPAEKKDASSLEKKDSGASPNLGSEAEGESGAAAPAKKEVLEKGWITVRDRNKTYMQNVACAEELTKKQKQHEAWTCKDRPTQEVVPEEVDASLTSILDDLRTELQPKLAAIKKELPEVRRVVSELEAMHNRSQPLYEAEGALLTSDDPFNVPMQSEGVPTEEELTQIIERGDAYAKSSDGGLRAKLAEARRLIEARGREFRDIALPATLLSRVPNYDMRTRNLTLGSGEVLKRSLVEVKRFVPPTRTASAEEDQIMNVEDTNAEGTSAAGGDASEGAAMDMEAAPPAGVSDDPADQGGDATMEGGDGVEKDQGDAGGNENKKDDPVVEAANGDKDADKNKPEDKSSRLPSTTGSSKKQEPTPPSGATVLSFDELLTLSAVQRLRALFDLELRTDLNVLHFEVTSVQQDLEALSAPLRTIQQKLLAEKEEQSLAELCDKGMTELLCKEEEMGMCEGRLATSAEALLRFPELSLEDACPRVDDYNAIAQELNALAMDGMTWVQNLSIDLRALTKHAQVRVMLRAERKKAAAAAAGRRGAPPVVGGTSVLGAVGGNLAPSAEEDISMAVDVAEVEQMVDGSSSSTAQLQQEDEARDADASMRELLRRCGVFRLRVNKAMGQAKVAQKKVLDAEVLLVLRAKDAMAAHFAAFSDEAVRSLETESLVSHRAVVSLAELDNLLDGGKKAPDQATSSTAEAAADSAAIAKENCAHDMDVEDGSAPAAESSAAAAKKGENVRPWWLSTAGDRGAYSAAAMGTILRNAPPKKTSGSTPKKSATPKKTTTPNAKDTAKADAVAEKKSADIVDKKASSGDEAQKSEDIDAKQDEAGGASEGAMKEEGAAAEKECADATNNDKVSTDVDEEQKSKSAPAADETAQKDSEAGASPDIADTPKSAEKAKNRTSTGSAKNKDKTTAGDEVEQVAKDTASPQKQAASSVDHGEVSAEADEGALHPTVASHAAIITADALVKYLDENGVPCVHRLVRKALEKVGGSAERISLHAFKTYLASAFYRCIAPTPLTEGSEIANLRRVRPVKVGETVQMWEKQIESSVGVQRGRVTCLEDAAQGWVTIQGNAGKNFFDAYSTPIFQIRSGVQPTVSFESTSAESGCRLFGGDYVQLLELPKLEKTTRRIRAPFVRLMPLVPEDQADATAKPSTEADGNKSASGATSSSVSNAGEEQSDASTTKAAPVASSSTQMVKGTIGTEASPSTAPPGKEVKAPETGYITLFEGSDVQGSSVGMFVNYPQAAALAVQEGRRGNRGVGMNPVSNLYNSINPGMGATSSSSPSTSSRVNPKNTSMGGGAAGGNKRGTPNISGGMNNHGGGGQQQPPNMLNRITTRHVIAARNHLQNQSQQFHQGGSSLQQHQSGGHQRGGHMVPLHQGLPPVSQRTQMIGPPPTSRGGGGGPQQRGGPYNRRGGGRR